MVSLGKSSIVGAPHLCKRLHEANHPWTSDCLNLLLDTSFPLSVVFHARMKYDGPKFTFHKRC